MNVPFVIEFLKALLLTDSIETVVLFAMIRFWFQIPKSKIPNSLLLFAGLFCSAGTLPYLWFVLRSFLSPYLVFLVVGEVLVFLVEAVFYYFVLKIGATRSLLVSLACNAASLIIGIAVL